MHFPPEHQGTARSAHSRDARPRPQSAPARVPGRTRRAPPGRAKGRAAAAVPLPHFSPRTAGTRRPVGFACCGPSSWWILRGMSWPLPFLARQCSPFLISPTTWCPWWRWSVSRVSAGRRRRSPSGYLSPRGRPGPPERPSCFCPRVL